MRKDSPALYFGTSNRHKFNEAKQILEPLNIKLGRLGEKGIEVQSERLEEIANYAAKFLTRRSNITVIVEDAGLFIDPLKGFPGPYSSFAYKTIGVEGVLRLMDCGLKRSATFLSVVSFCTPTSQPRYFKGIVRGEIAQRAKGSKGFGFDPIFIPDEGNGETFAEMSVGEKNCLSHRARALRRFARWYLS